MTQPQSFKLLDAASYDELADGFDRYTQRFSQYAVDAMLARIPAGTSGTILDIGCGTGVVTFAAADAFRQARVIGVDLSTGMLAFAREFSAKKGLRDRVEFRQTDAEALDIPDQSTDTVVSLYAWRHLPHPEKAAAEVHRVLRPGGTFVVAVGSAPALLSAAGLRAAAVRPARAWARRNHRELAACDHLDGLVERLLPKPQDREISQWSERHHGFSGSLEMLVKAAGFAVKGSEWAGRTFVIDNAEDFFELQATFSSSARKRIASAPPAAVEALRSAFFADCEKTLSRGGRLVYRVGAAIVSAVKL